MKENPFWEQDVVSSNLAVPTISKTSPSGRFFIVRTGPFELFRYAERSTAEFCKTQNIPPIREALTAGTERSVVNLAVPLVRRGHQILSIPFRYQHCEIWTFKDKSPCPFKYQTPRPARE
jgi:hypothetical protein